MNFDKLVAIATKITHDHHLAEDAVQDALMEVGDANEGLLVVCVRRRAHDTLRSRHETVSLDESVASADSFDTPHDAIDLLPTLEREAIVSSLEGKTNREISANAGVSHQAISKRMESARQHLKAMLQ